MTVQNATMDAIATIPAYEIGWLVTVTVFITVFIMIFLLSRNVRQFIYGAVVSTVLIIVYKIARWIGVSTSSGNTIPITWFAYIVGFIFMSIIVGRILLKVKWIQKLDKSFR